MNFQTDPGEEELHFDINVIPLIDVLLVLLIFFMVSASFVASGGLDVKLPASTSHSKSGEQLASRVTVLSDGTLQLENQSLSSKELTQRISQLLKESGQPVVVIQADEQAHHGDVVRAMDAIKAAGVDRVSIATTLQPPM